MWRGRTPLWLFGLAAGLGAGSAGCVIATGGDEAAFFVDWSLVYVESGQRVSCEDADTPKIELAARNLRTGEVTVDTFRCDARGAESRSLGPGAYDVRLSLKTSRGIEVSAIEGDFDLSRRGLTDLGKVQFQIQSFVATWIVTRDRQVSSCAQVGAASVNLVTQLGNDPPDAYKFPCADGGGETVAVPIGTYSITLELLGASDNVLSTTAAMPFVVSDRKRAVLPTTTLCIGRCN